MKQKLKVISQSKRAAPIVIQRKETPTVGTGILNLVNVRISGATVTSSTVKTSSLSNSGSKESPAIVQEGSASRLLERIAANIEGKGLKRKSVRVDID